MPRYPRIQYSLRALRRQSNGKYPRWKRNLFQERNATWLLCDTLILKSECQEDYNALEATWFQAYKPKNDAEKHLVQELVNSDWFQQRATRTLADAEARIITKWKIARLDRATSPRHRQIPALPDYALQQLQPSPPSARRLLGQANREGRNAERHEVFKEKNKPEPSIRELLDDMRAKKAEKDRLNQQS